MVAFFGPLGWPEIVIILVVALLLFGGKKLPELAKGLGKGLRVFKKEMKGVKEGIENAIETEPEYEDDAQEADNTEAAKDAQGQDVQEDDSEVEKMH
jgi:TatA/E family protein of Tat protein translocase